MPFLFQLFSNSLLISFFCHSITPVTLDVALQGRNWFFLFIYHRCIFRNRTPWRKKCSQYSGWIAASISGAFLLFLSVANCVQSAASKTQVNFAISRYHKVASRRDAGAESLHCLLYYVFIVHKSVWTFQIAYGAMLELSLLLNHFK